MCKDQHISFRAPSPVATALAYRAKRAGCSVSEYLRAVIREKIGLD